MWLVFTIIHCFTMALCNYGDEYLTHNNKVTSSQSSHRRIGGVLLISTLLGLITVGSLFTYLDDISISQTALWLSLASGVPMVLMWAAYFYLFLRYPAHQVVPLFGISSVWLLGLEALTGAVITPVLMLGIALLLYGAYVLDSNSLRWKIPTELLLIMIPTSLLWAMSLFMVRLASEAADVLTIFFYQYVAVTIIGGLLFLLIRPYREGFLFRIKTQGKTFLGVSLFNEVIAQISFLAVMIAVTLAPLAVYVTALTGLQSIFVLLIFYLFPLHERNTISPYQWFAILMIVFGIFVIEFWK